MDPRQLFTDERLTGFCVYCGAKPNSRDHCPSKIFLDEPYPSDLPVVDSCRDCNNGFSLDEQYLACIVEAVICGSVNPERISRERIKTILANTPALALRLQKSQTADQCGDLVWNVEQDRVSRIVLKLARGHLAYELGLAKMEDPEYVQIKPLLLMSREQRSEFEASIENPHVWPEIGSRAFIKAIKGSPEPNLDSTGWTIVQEGRYRYRVDQSYGDGVRLVISEYLACQVAWY